MSAESASAAQTPSAQGKATLKSGVRVQDVKVGSKVSDLRAEYGGLFRIPSDAKAYSGNQELSEDTVITENMTVEFMKKSGEKG